MTLKEYLRLLNVRPYRWADEHGYHRRTVYGWLKGVIPEPQYMARIEKDTEGAVRCQDWVGGG